MKHPAKPTPPAERKRQWGHVIWEDPGGLPAGSHQTLTLRFVTGSLGIDERGGIRVSFRTMSDFGTPQFHDPTADNYVTATTRGARRLELDYSIKGNVRPFQKTLFIHVLDGSLFQGDEIKLVLGDTAGGSKGWRIQTYVEPEFLLRVETDPFGAHSYAVLPEQPHFEVVPNVGHTFQVCAPSLAGAGEPITLRVKCEDVWGNPLRDLPARPQLIREREADAQPPLRVKGQQVDAPPGDAPPVEARQGETRPVEAEPVHREGVLFYQVAAPEEPGVYRYRIPDGAGVGAAGGPPAGALSNPLVVLPAPPETPYHWCDLHGQTGETIGIGTVEGYFHFGRHFGFLDGSCHQGNDFQIDGATWERIVAAANDAYLPGEFVTIQGIEWSGTTPMGGDHNILFNEDHPPLIRSTGWLASDGSQAEEVAPLSKLYDVLRGRDAMTIPHIGGRPAALEETDPQVERLVELHSAWGTFEWVYQRAFAKGYKVGFVCNSDGHKQRPGASYPGASTFGVLGGLTCIPTAEKTRQAFWDALRARRCYGTTGQRIFVEVSAEGQPMGADVTVGGPFSVTGRVHGTAPLLGVDLLREAEVIATALPPALTSQPGEEDWIVIRLGGSRVYGRERKVGWQGRVALEGATLLDARLHGSHNPLRGIRGQGRQGFDFDLITTGNSLNLALRLDRPGEGALSFQSGPATFSLPLAEVAKTPRRMFEAPIDQFVEILRCPIAALPWGMEFQFQAPEPAAPATPYFVRVRQLDEGKAFTSPFYVSKGQ